MKIDIDRFVLAQAGKYGKKLHIYSCGWLAKPLCGRSKAQKKVHEYEPGQICKTCAKMYPEISQSALAQMFLGF